MSVSKHGPKVPPEPRYTGHVRTTYLGGPKDGFVHGFSCCPPGQYNAARTRIEYVCGGCDETKATLVYVPEGTSEALLVVGEEQVA